MFRKQCSEGEVKVKRYDTEIVCGREIGGARATADQSLSPLKAQKRLSGSVKSKNRRQDASATELAALLIRTGEDGV
jgi:hypothetical protein